VYIFTGPCAVHPPQYSCCTCLQLGSVPPKRPFLHPLHSIAFTSSADGDVFPVLQVTNELERALLCRFAFLPEWGFSAGKHHCNLEVVLALAHLSCLRKAGRDLRGFRHD